MEGEGTTTCNVFDQMAANYIRKDGFHPSLKLPKQVKEAAQSYHVWRPGECLRLCQRDGIVDMISHVIKTDIIVGFLIELVMGTIAIKAILFKFLVRHQPRLDMIVLGIRLKIEDALARLLVPMWLLVPAYVFIDSVWNEHEENDSSFSDIYSLLGAQ